MNRISRGAAVAMALAGLAACDAPSKAKSGALDELTIVVQADKRELEAQEKALKNREEALKTEAGQLDARIKELATSRVAADLEHRRRLDGELLRAKAAQEELALRVQVLQQQKAAMEVQRTVLESPKAQTSSSLALRESMIAAREARLSARESSLVAREADLATREKAVAKREQAVPKPEAADPTAVHAVHREGEHDKPGPATLRDVPSRADIEGRHKRLLAEMHSRGVLVSDLSSEDQPLNAEIHNARRNGDYARAADLLVDLARAIARLRVDQQFVEAKMVRLQGQRSSIKLRQGPKSEIEKLLKDVTASYSDGQYEKANRGLNRIAAILDASRASG